MFTPSLSNHAGWQTDLSRNKAIFLIQFTFLRFEICPTTPSRFPLGGGGLYDNKLKKGEFESSNDYSIDTQINLNSFSESISPHFLPSPGMASPGVYETERIAFPMANVSILNAFFHMPVMVILNCRLPWVLTEIWPKDWLKLKGKLIDSIEE